MKAITLCQPYATLVATGVKKIETRSWRTDYRGPLAIHASSRIPWEYKLACTSREICRALGWPECPRLQYIDPTWMEDNRRRVKELPTGKVIAVATLVRIFETAQMDLFEEEVSAQERLLGDYRPGRWAWELRDARPLEQPVIVMGKLGLWEWEEPQAASNKAA